MALTEAIQVRTHEDDVLDALVHQAYGRTDGPLEAVLDANPVLETVGAILPVGLTLQFPADASPPAETRRRLWD